MRIETWDTGFVRARRRDVHALTGPPPERYAEWWPGLRARPLSGGGAEWVLKPPGRLRRAHRLTVTLVKNRKDLGVSLRVTGDVDGEAEFYYLDEVDGVAVSYVLRAEVPGGAANARRFTRDHRAAVRAALHALKDRCEGGRVPGSEPDPLLLTDQVLAIAEFRAGVEAHARKVAAEAERTGDPAAD